MVTVAVMGMAPSSGKAGGQPGAWLSRQVQHSPRDEPCSCCGQDQGSHPTPQLGRVHAPVETRTTQKPGPAGELALGGRAAGSLCRAAPQSLSTGRAQDNPGCPDSSGTHGAACGIRQLHPRQLRSGTGAGGAPPPPGSYKYRSRGMSAQHQRHRRRQIWSAGGCVGGAGCQPPPHPAPRTGARGTWGLAGARPVARAQPVSHSARARPAAAPTCDRGEVDADEQGEVGGHVAEDVRLVHIHRRVRGAHRGHPPLLHDHAFGQVRAPEVLCKKAGGQAARPA